MSISYREIRPEDAEMLIRWRTSDFVNSKMLTNIRHIELSDQIKWINSLYQKPFGYSWIVCSDGKDIGYTNFSLHGSEHTVGSGGFYIYDPAYRAIATLVLLHSYNLGRSISRMQSSFIVIRDDNKNIIKINESLGFVRATDKEKKHFDVEVPSGFSLYIYHNSEKMNPFLDVVAQYPIKLWIGRDPSVTSKLFVS